MSSRKVFPVAAFTLLTLLAVSLFMLPTSHMATRHAMARPMIQKGPDAQFAGQASPDFGLFTCQVVNLSPNTTCYDPFQMRTAYNVDKLIAAGLDGHGKTIVIVDAFQSPRIVNELNTFNAFYGLASLNGLGAPDNPALGTFTQVAPDGLTPFTVGDANQAGWAEEITLDVLWAHAIAPGANITLVLAKSNSDDDILSATRFAVDNNLGDVISQSFGENESCMDPATIAAQHQVFADATRKNITLFASAGDDGAALPNCDGTAFVKAASSPAVDPLVTAVGGTELHAARYCLPTRGCDPAANPAPGTYDSEVVWNESAIGFGATGGGFSVLFDNPHFQDGTIKHGNKQRGEADISYNAAVLHGVLTFLDIPGVGTGFSLFGGTSAGSPQWAAITAIADQAAGRNLGFINDALYHIGKNRPRSAAAFHDVTVGDNTLSDPDTGLPIIVGFPAATGWDPPTGLGTPKSDAITPLLDKEVNVNDGAQAIHDSAPHSNNSGPGIANSHHRVRPN